MRAIWVNEGAELGNYQRLRDLEMTHVYWSERTHKKAHLDQARREGFAVGLYTNPQWYDFSDPAELAFALNRTLINKFKIKSEQCDVQINYETHEAAYIVKYIEAWRKVRQTRPTYWTMEGHQAGWAWVAMNNPALLGKNPDDPRTVTMLSPQAYDGSMKRWDSWGVVKDLIDYGVSAKRIFPFYDASEAQIPYTDGFFYMEHRL